MWIATRNGLNIFDGVTFDKITSGNSNGLSISNNDIICLQKDDQGRVWIGTYNGLNLYDPKTENIESFYHRKVDNSLPNNTIWDVCQLSDNLFAIATSEGLSLFNYRDRTFNNLIDPNLLQGLHITKLLKLKDDSLLVGTTQGLVRVSIEGDKFGLVYPYVALKNKHVQDVIALSDNDFLIGTKYSGIIQLNTTDSTVTQGYKDYEVATDVGHSCWMLANDFG